MSIERALVADDEPLAREFLAESLGARGIEVVTAADGDEALRRFGERDFDLVVSDLRMPGKDGLELLERVRERAPEVPFVLVTAHGDVDTAVAAIRLGAADFLAKPFSLEAVEGMVARIEKRRRLEDEVSFLRAERRSEREDEEIVAASAAMRAVLSKADRVALTDATVLVEGETGTGKELVAWRLHEKSARRAGPFVRVSCAALSETLLASELFGHERGAFAEATRRCVGRFELADGGTLVLDEVAELPLGLQAKCLRVIEERRFERVGGTRPIQTDVRIVATTSRDLRSEVARGRFREDLFFRLHVMPLRIPPLRERKEDVRALARHFAERFAREHGGAPGELPDDVQDVLAAHSWPGNVRELRHAVLRAVVMGRGETLCAEDVAKELLAPARVEAARPAAPGAPEGYVGKKLGDVERDLILKTLERTRFNRTEAARILGLTARTLFNKIRLYESQGHVAIARRKAAARPRPKAARREETA